jgi:tellurite methyltransferase
MNPPASEMGFLNPSKFLLDHWQLLYEARPSAPVLDLACGEGHNGLFLASRGFRVVLCDVSPEALNRARMTAEALGIEANFWLIDLEQAGPSPLKREAYAALLVFRYLHRPLMGPIKDALVHGGLLFYETYTVGQPKFGKPRNPDHLLNPGELLGWFAEWETPTYFEGELHCPDRAMAQLVARKPA